MKKLEFETSKGMFLIKEYDTFNDLVKDANFYKQKICKLSEITEEQANAIVDEPVKFFNPANLYCVEDVVYINYNSGKGFWTAIESLHSLLKSKGVHLFENPFDLNEQLDCNCDMCYQKLEDAFDEAEQKTFYNPYIFKICTKQQS